MSIYTRIILFVTGIFIASIVLTGIIQYRTISRYYALYHPRTTQNTLVRVQDHFSKEVQNGGHDKHDFGEIRSLSGKIGRLLLTMEELDILKDEITLYMILSTAIIPLIILSSGILAILLLIKNLFKPIKRLTEAMSHYSAGDPSLFPLPVTGSPEARLLAETTNEMMETINRQKDIISLQGKFLGWRESAREIMHELKNILTPARLAAESGYESARDHDNPVMKKNFGTVIESFIMIGRMMEALKDLSNMRMPDPADIDLYEISRKSVEMYSEKFKPITLEGSSIIVHADESLIRSALDNLIVNAIEATSGTTDAAITVRVGRQPHPFVECRDNGPGIPPDLMEKIFKLHFTTKPGGSGFGLYFVKKVMTDHGYRVELGPGIGGNGTTARMVFHGNNSDR